MNKRTLFSITAACAIAIAAIAGASAAAIAATTPAPTDGASAAPPRAASTSSAAPDPVATPLTFPAVGGDVGRPWEPSDVMVTEKQIRKVVYDNNAMVRAVEPGNPPANRPLLDSLVTEGVMDVKCMAAKGFYYNPVAAPGKANGRFDPAAFVALLG